MKQYCPVCLREREVRLAQKEETYPVKGEAISVAATVCACAVCGEELLSIEYDDENLRKAYEKYRALHGLLTPPEIKAIRESYGVSQVTFARVLGVGDKTIARYENGSLQDCAINNLILLAKDPKNFMLLLDKNEHCIAADEAKHLRAACGQVKVYVLWKNEPKDYTYDMPINGRIQCA